MEAGEYLVEVMMPADWEPKMWVVERMDRGRVDLSRVNPTNLVRTGDTRRVDLYWAKRMHKYDPSDKEFQSLMRALYQYRAQVRRHVDALPSEVGQSGTERP